MDIVVVMIKKKKGVVSLSMKFQASRFSASGRKMPLEPRRSEACRSCQPMHVLSFGEGRKWFVCWSSQANPFGCAYLRPRRGEEGFGIRRLQAFDALPELHCVKVRIRLIRILCVLPGPRVFQDAKELILNCILGMSCDHGYTLRQCEAEPHLFVDGDSIKCLWFRNSSSRNVLPPKGKRAPSGRLEKQT